MKDTLSVGLTHSFTYCVPGDKTVQHVYPESEMFRAMPPVFATAYLVGLIEWACMQLLEPYLDSGEQSLGTAIAVTHTAPTPVGVNVTAEVRVEDIAGKRITFRVSARDEVESIGEGTHERFVIERDRFMKRIAQKASRSESSR